MTRTERWALIVEIAEMQAMTANDWQLRECYREAMAEQMRISYLDPKYQTPEDADRILIEMRARLSEDTSK